MTDQKYLTLSTQVMDIKKEKADFCLTFTH